MVIRVIRLGLFRIFGCWLLAVGRVELGSFRFFGRGGGGGWVCLFGIAFGDAV